MKKLIIASAVAAGMFGASLAQADTFAGTVSHMADTWDERSYAQAKLGFVDLGTDDDGIGLTGTFGMDASEIHENLSFEVELMTTVVDGETTYQSSVGDAKVEASAFSLGGYAVGTFEQFAVAEIVPYARVGLAYTSVDMKASNSVASASGDDSDIGLGIGVGLKYEFADKLHGLVEFNSTDVDVMNAGIGYRF